jgi:hypothetical protein
MLDSVSTKITRSRVGGLPAMMLRTFSTNGGASQAK